MKKTKLIRQRKRLGFNQEQMASVINVERSNYSRRENGEIPISEDEWVKLADKLEIPVEDIYEGEVSNRFEFHAENSIGQNIGGSPVFYSIPKELFDIQHKYIKILEEKVEKYEKEK